MMSEEAIPVFRYTLDAKSEGPRLKFLMQCVMEASFPEAPWLMRMNVATFNAYRNYTQIDLYDVMGAKLQLDDRVPDGEVRFEHKKPSVAYANTRVVNIKVGAE